MSISSSGSKPISETRLAACFGIASLLGIAWAPQIVRGRVSPMPRFVPRGGVASGNGLRCSGAAAGLASVEPLFDVPTNEIAGAHLVSVPGMRTADLATKRSRSLSMDVLVMREVWCAPQLRRSSALWRPLDVRSHQVFLARRHVTGSRPVAAFSTSVILGASWHHAIICKPIWPFASVFPRPGVAPFRRALPTAVSGFALR